MISEQKQKIIEIIGEKHSDELRHILNKVVIENWALPNQRFSPLMVEHLLYFIAKSMPIMNDDLFLKLLALKFSEEYGYQYFPALLPKLIEDLATSLSNYCNQHFPLQRVAPQRSIEKVFREPIMLYLDGYKVVSKSKESIRNISGLPPSFLLEFFKNFDLMKAGRPLSDEMESYFGDFFRSIYKELAL
ncbi:hypothetical protein ACFL27_28535 [candidate division CSSED10-310 bacterium]|uniref:Uncharacterized protein n=1 Tax=candidate division CSSED10-310 bacterium TaxID=2855610 RepID=A0ABV6Z6T5_UNCC1